jgi:Mlc titration factor MtfA (ptsG expression regulator)
MIAIILILITAVGAIGWIVSATWRRTRQRNAVMAQPFPKSWRQVLKQRFPYFKAMPADLQLQLKKHIQIFINEKTFIGCDGFEITEEVKVTIAAQACLLLLNRKTDYYPKLKEILVYPYAFITEQKQTDFAGVESKRSQVLLGQSWEMGKVVLSWKSTLEGAADPTDGANVVIHEFAHQLDQENGGANGAPILGDITAYPRWSSVLSHEFTQLQHNAQYHLPSIFDYYGATNAAEFFAVISEVFFEKPKDFAREHPKLYQELSQFYRLDPLHWQ